MTIYHILLYCLIYLIIGFATTITLYATKTYNFPSQDWTDPSVGMLIAFWPIVWLGAILVAISHSINWLVGIVLRWMGHGN